MGEREIAYPWQVLTRVNRWEGYMGYILKNVKQNSKLRQSYGY